MAFTTREGGNEWGVSQTAISIKKEQEEDSIEIERRWALSFDSPSRSFVYKLPWKMTNNGDCGGR